MWLKYLAVTLILYLFAVLQNSFFVHFSAFGFAPNLVLIFCFIVIFFEKPDKFHMSLFTSIFAGFFLDVFSHNYFGISIVFLLLLIFASKKIILLLWERNDKYSLLYFIPLFVAYFIIYNSLVLFNLSLGFIIAIVYNLIFAVTGFFICLKLNIK